MKRKYLAVFLVPKLEAEHATIPAAVAHHSGGDFKQAFSIARKDGAMIGYVFTSEKVPWEMGLGLLNPDQALIVELGELYDERNLNVAGAWLRARQSPKPQ